MKCKACYGPATLKVIAKITGIPKTKDASDDFAGTVEYRNLTCDAHKLDVGNYAQSCAFLQCVKMGFVPGLKNFEPLSFVALDF